MLFQGHTKQLTKQTTPSAREYISVNFKILKSYGVHVLIKMELHNVNSARVAGAGLSAAAQQTAPGTRCPPGAQPELVRF